MLAWVWDPDSPAGPRERSWEALLEALGKAHLPRPQKSTKHRQSKWLRYRGGPVWPAPNECSRRGEHGFVSWPVLVKEVRLYPHLSATRSF